MRALSLGAVLALVFVGACGRGDSSGEGDDGGSIFGDTGGLIAVDPNDGGAGGASGTGSSSSGGTGTGGALTSGSGTGSSSGGGTTTAGSGGTSSAGGSGSSGGGTSGGTTGGGTSSGGGNGGCPIDFTCTGDFPFCDQNRSPPACVASADDTVGEFCFSDSDCNFGLSGTGVVCDLIFTCAPGCWSADDCTSDLPYCDTNSLAPSCVAGPSDTLGDFCFQDADCNFGLSESQIVCSLFTCVIGCHADADCSPNACCDGFWEPGSCDPC